MKTLGAEPVQLIDRLLTLLFAVLAVVKIVSDLYRPVPAQAPRLALAEQEARRPHSTPAQEFLNHPE